jgi:hypothetical protein
MMVREPDSTNPKQPQRPMTEAEHKKAYKKRQAAHRYASNKARKRDASAVHYAVLAMHSGTGPYAEFKNCSFEVFAGETELAAVSIASESLLASSVDSRAEHEYEHGAVSDKEWLKLMKEAGFIIKPASQGLTKSFGLNAK